MKTNEGNSRTGTSSPSHSASPPFFSREGPGQLSFFTDNAPAPFFSARPVQPKLEVGAPDDVYERQADAVADAVVSKSGSAASAAPQELDDDRLQRKSDGAAGPVTPAFTGQLDASRGGGQPLPSDVSESMGTAIGADFSGVRVHTDATAAEMSRSIAAQAFTSGSDIYFNEGRYNTSSAAGQRLLAHELTHTVQQNADIRRKPLQRKPDISMAPAHTIQRGIGDWGGWPWNWGSSGSGGATDPAAPPAKVLKKVTAGGSNTGGNFDSAVSVPAPLPAQGDMTVTMRININFQDTNLKFITDNILSSDQANIATWKAAIEKVQKADPSKLKWTEPEKEKVRKDYQKNVADVWPSDKTKLTFKLDDPDYEKYQVRNNFKLEFTDKSPHHSFSVVKMIDGPTLRSYMGGGIGGFHDSRTFGGTQNNGTTHNMLSDQIGEFDNNSAVVTSGIAAKIAALATNIKKIKDDHKSDTPAPIWNLGITGRANATGDAAQNLKLSRQRAAAVGAEAAKTIGSDVSISTATDPAGNAVADTSTKYRRVEVVFRNTNGTQMDQITMAHETGHLFGYGDEYGDVSTGGVLPKYTGDESNNTSKAIRDAGMGEDVVKQHRVENSSDSIMNRGNVVGVGHYSLFLTQLKDIATDETTNAKVNWQVVKG